MKHKLSRLYYLIAAFAVMCLGLLSRRVTNYMPDIINLYLGDLLWATMIYFLIRTLFVNITIKRTVIISLLFCYLIEISQIYHSSWIDALRSTTLGGLILGYGFLWSDLASYLFGIVTGAAIDSFILFPSIKSIKLPRGKI